VIVRVWWRTFAECRRLIVEWAVREKFVWHGGARIGQAVLGAVVQPSGLGPHRTLEEVRPGLKEYLPGLLAQCRWPLHTSLLEGINNKIEVIKRMAYGFRDDDYFFLKIRAAFPGNTG
jgi:hypothetical protein